MLRERRQADLEHCRGGGEGDVSVPSFEILPSVVWWCPAGPGCYFTLVEDAPLTLLGSSLRWAGVVSSEGGEDFPEKESAGLGVLGNQPRKPKCWTSVHTWTAPSYTSA